MGRRYAQGANAADSTSALPFDLDTAIRVCRQAGYFEHAAYLAKKYVRHEEYLRIQVEDAQNYKEALEYLRGMGEDAVSPQNIYVLFTKIGIDRRQYGSIRSCTT